MEFKHELVKPNEDISVVFLTIEEHANIVPKHWHNHMEIIYILEGSLEVAINNSVYTVLKDQLIAISPRDIHSTINKHGNKSILLQIPYEFLENNIKDVQNLHFDCTPYIMDTEKIPYQKDIKLLLKSFAAFYDSKPLGYKLKTNSIIYDLLFILVNKFSTFIPQADIQNTVRYLDRLDLITKYVKSHYDNSISLDEISAHAGLNPEYFSRFFKKYMGMTFLNYLNSIRLQHFYIDLTNTDYSITELLEKNGFTNYKIFMKLFKETYGCTPKEARKLLHKKYLRNEP